MEKGYPAKCIIYVDTCNREGVKYDIRWIANRRIYFRSNSRIWSWTVFYFDAVDPITGCHSLMNQVEVYTTPKFEVPRLVDVVSCASDDSLTLTAHVSYPLDLVTDGYDNFTFLT